MGDYAIASILLIGLRCIYANGLRLRNDFIQVVYWAHLEASFIMLPIVLRLLNSYEIGGAKPIGWIFWVGQMLLAAFFLCGLFFRWFVRQPHQCPRRKSIPISPGWQNILQIALIGSAFAVTIIAFNLNIGIMGQNVEVVYSYKLAGILVGYTTQLVVPLGIFLLDLPNPQHDSNNTGRNAILIALFLIWALIQSYCISSKGFLSTVALNLVMYFVIKGIESIRLYAVLILSVASIVIMFPMMTVLRDLTAAPGSVKSAGIAKVMDETREADMNSNEAFAAIYFRTFGTGAYMSKFAEYVDNEWFCNNIETMRSFRGGSRFHTQVVDKVPESVAHSSGITFYSEAFLYGGLLWTVVSVLVLAVFAHLADRGLLGPMSRTACGRTILTMFVLTVLNLGFWDTFWQTSLMAYAWYFILPTFHFLCKYFVDEIDTI